MRLFDGVVLVAGIVGAMTWIVHSSKDGFKANNAMILARTIAISATIDGQIDNTPPTVGDKVGRNDLLVHIQNNRIDRSRLVEFDSQIKYLKSEIKNINALQAELSTLLKDYKRRSAAYAQWLLKDLQLKRTVNRRRLDVSKKQEQLMIEEVKRAAFLYRKKHTSKVNLDVAKTKAEIAKNKVSVTKAELERSEELLRSLQANGVFFEDGDTSYWEKMVDTLRVRFIDNASKLSLLKAKLLRAHAQERVERRRINSSYTEEHRAPFTGIVNETYVTKGTRVTSGTSLLQILDCTKPIVIVPIPEHRIGEFSVGLDVTIYPIDSEQALKGTISYLSNGALIGHDKTIQIQQNLTTSGNRAIVKLTNQARYSDSERSCETSRKAIVVIHTSSQFESASNWLYVNVPKYINRLSSKVAEPLTSLIERFTKSASAEEPSKR